jgi:hypothetical protein
MCAYRQLFMITHYEYVGLCEEAYQKELSWKKKIICVNEFAGAEMLAFLRQIEESDLKKTLGEYPDRRLEEVVFGEDHFIVKSTQIKGIFINLLRMGTAVNIWNHAHYARKMGIPVLRPVALVEKREINSTKTFVVYLREGEVCEKQVMQASFLEKVAQLRGQLRQKYVTHHDFYVRNIVMLEDGSLQLIDIDKMHWYPKHSYLYSKKCQVEERRFKRDLTTNF